MKHLFVFGYKVKPKPSNPDYLKMTYGYAGVWIVGSSQWFCKHAANGIVLAEEWEIISEEDALCISPEQLTRPEQLEKYQAALISPRLYVLKVAPGETQGSGLN